MICGRMMIRCMGGGWLDCNGSGFPGLSEMDGSRAAADEIYCCTSECCSIPIKAHRLLACQTDEHHLGH